MRCNKEWFHDQVRAREGMKTHIYNSSVPGTFIMEATINFMPSAIGVLWFKWCSNQGLEILQSYVHHQFRRLGVRTWMHEQLQKAYPTVRKFVTLGTTKDSKPWLKKMGFKKDEFQDWILVVEKKRSK